MAAQIKDLLTDRAPPKFRTMGQNVDCLNRERKW
jgi:hypothetical protein